MSGGAVELSWKLRPASSALSDKFVDCASGQPGTGAVANIRLHWRTDRPGATEGSQAWSCEDSHGATGFELEEGIAQLWITPECAVPGTDATASASPDSFIAPAITERRVVRGETVSLGAVELVVSVSNCRDPADPANEGKRACICAE